MENVEFSIYWVCVIKIDEFFKKLCIKCYFVSFRMFLLFCLELDCVYKFMNLFYLFLLDNL